MARSRQCACELGALFSWPIVQELGRSKFASVSAKQQAGRHPAMTCQWQCAHSANARRPFRLRSHPRRSHGDCSFDQDGSSQMTRSLQGNDPTEACSCFWPAAGFHGPALICEFFFFFLNFIFILFCFCDTLCLASAPSTGEAMIFLVNKFLYWHPMLVYVLSGLTLALGTWVRTLRSASGKSCGMWAQPPDHETVRVLRF